MKRLFKAALVIVSISGFQTIATVGASAADRTQPAASHVDLTKYAAVPGAKTGEAAKSFKVASRRSRRRNRNVAGGVLAAGVAAIIINEAIRSSRRNDDRYYYRDDRYSDDRRYNDRYQYNRHYAYPGRRTCRIWARRCDNGRYSQCRKWNRRCR